MSIIVNLSTLSANDVGIPVGIAVIILVAMLLSALILFCLCKKNRCFRQAIEPIYEIPVAPVYVARDDRGPYEEYDVNLDERPSDQEGFI